MKLVIAIVITFAVGATGHDQARGDPKADKLALCEELAGKRTGSSRKDFITNCKASALNDEAIAINRKCNADAGKRVGKALDEFLGECRRRAFEAARKKKQEQRDSR